MAYSTISKPSDYFNTKLYTGNGSTNAITGVGHQPDWNWIKCRSHADSSQIFDVLRTTYALRSDGNNAEAVGNGWTSLDSDGFTLNGDSSGGNVNNSGRTYASWNWKANGAGSSNTDGSITSTVSANTTSGFSIVSYTGTDSTNTIGHSLSAVPNVIIIKDRDAGNDWFVYHSGNTSAPETDYLKLNSTNATADLDSLWNDTAPTSSVFTIGTNGNINTTGNDYIAYCFAEKKGFSKFGSYTGNGNADGIFVYTGFKPAFVIIKKTDGADNWTINDNKRVGYNVDNNELFANLSNAEDTNDVLDLLSNGFKLRHTAGRHNTSGGTYIYMCFAESPFVTSSGIPTCAR